MKKKKSKKSNILFIILCLIPIVGFFFKDQIYIFLIKFEKFEKLVDQVNLDEFTNKDILNSDKDLLKISNRIDDKNIFELFRFSKKSKLRSQEIENYLKNNKKISLINSNEKLINKLVYSYSNDKKSTIIIDSIILTGGENISCDCLDILKGKALIFESKGAAANKIETPNYITITYENKKSDIFEIKNNQNLKLSIPTDREGKNITISWKKNSSGVLFFYGAEKKQILNSQKIVFITANLEQKEKFINSLKEKINPENSFISGNSYPLYSNFEKNIRSLETNSTPINNGYTYNSNDLFKEKEKYFFNTINQKSKDLLRINIFSEETKDSQIQHSNTLVNIKREKSIYSTANIVIDTIKNSNADVIRVDINTHNINNISALLEIINILHKDVSLFVLTGYDYDINFNILNSNQSFLISFPNQDHILVLNELKKKLNENKFQQNIAVDTILKVVKEDKKQDNINLPSNIVIQAKDDDAYIFNNEEYISNNKFKVSLDKMKLYQKEIEETRSHNQLKDISFSFINVKMAKIKIFSKDKLLRCFSNKNIRNSIFGFDQKQNYFTVELKMSEEENIDEWELSCLINSDSFINEYKIESQKEGKPLSPSQIAIGQYVLHPNPSLINNNFIMLNNYSDFSLLKAKTSPRLVDKSYKEDLMIWSNDYPTLSPSLKYSVTYEEKK